MNKRFLWLAATTTCWACIALLLNSGSALLAANQWISTDHIPIMLIEAALLNWLVIQGAGAINKRIAFSATTTWQYRVHLFTMVCIIAVCGVQLAVGNHANRPEAVFTLSETAHLPSGYTPPDKEYYIDAGYKLTLVASGFTAPSSLTFGGNHEVYVSEAGSINGVMVGQPRILQVFPNGTKREIANMPSTPLVAIQHHNGFIYAFGGRSPGELWRIKPINGRVETVISGFPVWGLPTMSNLAFGADSWLYFAVGSPANAGVISPDSYWNSGWLALSPAARAIPCIDTILNGINFTTENPTTPNPHDTAVTGAFKMFSEPSGKGEIVKATPAPGCNGVVFRSKADGSHLEVYATGLRNLTGLAFSPSGHLYGVQPGYENNGSRPIANDYDTVWEIARAGWYGYPDYPSGLPVTNPRFRGKGTPALHFLLAEHPNISPGPAIVMTPRAQSKHISFSNHAAFGFKGSAFITQAGSQQDSPGHGYRIIRANLETGEQHDFYQNRLPGPDGTALESPVAAEFGSDGCLYVVDQGYQASGTPTQPLVGTGSLWRICRENT